MGFLPSIFSVGPQKLSIDQVATLSKQAYDSTHQPPDRPAKLQGPKQLKRHKKGLYQAPAGRGKSSVQEHVKARRLLLKHFDDPHYRGFYGADKADEVYKALQALPMGFEDEQLYKALAPISQAQRCADIGSASRAVAAEALSLRSQGGRGGLPDDPSEHDSSAGDQATKQLEKAVPQFQKFCTLRKQEKPVTKRQKQALDKAFQKAFVKHELTRDLQLTPATLYQKVVLDAQANIEKLQERLENQLSTWNKLDAYGEALRNREIQALSEELMSCIEQSIQRLALVGDVLANDLAPAAPGLMQRPMIDLGDALVAWGGLQNDRHEGFAAVHGWAHDCWREAVNHQAGSAVQAKSQAVIDSIRQLAIEAGDPKRVSEPVKLAPDWAQERDEAAYLQAMGKAQSAGNRFAELFDQADGTAGTARMPRELARRLQVALGSQTLSEDLAESERDLFDELLVDMPNAIRTAMEGLDKAVSNARTERGSVDAAAQSKVVKRSEKLMDLIASYGAVLATTAHALTHLDRQGLSTDEQRRILDFAVSLLGLSQAIMLQGSPHRVLFDKALQQQRLAKQTIHMLNSLKPEPRLEPRRQGLRNEQMARHRHPPVGAQQVVPADAEPPMPVVPAQGMPALPDVPVIETEVHIESVEPRPPLELVVPLQSLAEKQQTPPVQPARKPRSDGRSRLQAPGSSAPTNETPPVGRDGGPVRRGARRVTASLEDVMEPRPQKTGPVTRLDKVDIAKALSDSDATLEVIEVPDGQKSGEQADKDLAELMKLLENEYGQPSPRQPEPPSGGIRRRRSAPVHPRVNSASAPAKHVKFAPAPNIRAGRSKTGAEAGPVHQPAQRPPVPREPKDAFAEFIEKGFTPQDGASALSIEQRELAGWLQARLQHLGLPLADAVQLGEQLKSREEDVRAKAMALNRLVQHGGATPEEIVSASTGLVMTIDAYLGVLGMAAKELVNGPADIMLPLALVEATKAAGQFLLSKEKQLRADGSDMMRWREDAMKLSQALLSRPAQDPAAPAVDPADTQPNPLLSPRSQFRADLDGLFTGMKKQQPTSPIAQQGANATSANESLDSFFDELNAGLTKKK